MVLHVRFTAVCDIKVSPTLPIMTVHKLLFYAFYAQDLNMTTHTNGTRTLSIVKNPRKTIFLQVARIMYMQVPYEIQSTLGDNIRT